MRWFPSTRVLIAVCLASMLVACATPLPHRRSEGGAHVDCSTPEKRAENRCFEQTPETSTKPAYTLHFVELDDQGWQYPRPEDPGHTEAMGSAHAQIDRAIGDLARRLQAGEAVMLLVFVHGWKHGAADGDRDVMRFREILSDAASVGEFTREQRKVVGIYVGWRGAGRLSPRNPLVYLSFWTRKNTALHVSGGASRELFARLRVLRERSNEPKAGVTPEQRLRALQRPPLRTIVIGHSFGGWVAFSALSPSILELLARAVDPAPGPSEDETAWLAARVRGTADMVVLLNPAFEATRYQPLHRLAERVSLRRFESPVLVIITSTADWATGIVFPWGRRVNTLLQRPFISSEEEVASVETPGFVDAYRTHRLTRSLTAAACDDWEPPEKPASASDVATEPTESPDQRLARTKRNVGREVARHEAWRAELAKSAGVLAPEWSWEYCGKSKLELIEHRKPYVPIWNITTDKTLIRAHSDIMQEPLHAFLRQLYMNLSR
jgi:pimeloyl-ACP methyl ester carboxylesterase